MLSLLLGQIVNSVLGPVFTPCTPSFHSLLGGRGKASGFHLPGRDRCLNFACDVFYNVIVVGFPQNRFTCSLQEVSYCPWSCLWFPEWGPRAVDTVWHRYGNAHIPVSRIPFSGGRQDITDCCVQAAKGTWKCWGGTNSARSTV